MENKKNSSAVEAVYPKNYFAAVEPVHFENYSAVQCWHNLYYFGFVLPMQNCIRVVCSQYLYMGSVYFRFVVIVI